jgi:hypothetical protein
VQEVGEELEIFVVIAGADLVHRGVHAQVDEVEAVTGVAAAMVVRVTNEPWRAREELPPIEGPRR